MTGRLLFIVAILLAVMTGPEAASAADPAFCRQYARATLAQVHVALQDPHCGAALRGARWSAEFAVHYEWCLGASPDEIHGEREARTDYLKSCR
jgi:hypothetical protein